MGFYGLRMGFYGVRTGYARVAQNQVLMGFMGCERVLNGVLRCMDGFPTGFYGVSTGCGRVPAFSSLRISQKVFKTKWNPKPTSMILQFSTNNRSPNFKGPSWMNFIIFDKPDIHSMFKFESFHSSGIWRWVPQRKYRNTDFKSAWSKRLESFPDLASINDSIAFGNCFGRLGHPYAVPLRLSMIEETLRPKRSG